MDWLNNNLNVHRVPLNLRVMDGPKSEIKEAETEGKHAILIRHFLHSQEELVAFCGFQFKCFASDGDKSLLHEP